MTYRWSLDAYDRSLLIWIAEKTDSEIMQKFLQDRPDIRTEDAGYIEVSGFERYVLEVELSKISSRIAGGGNDLGTSGTSTHAYSDFVKLSGDITALSGSLQNMTEAFPAQDASFLDDIV